MISNRPETLWTSVPSPFVPNMATPADPDTIRKQTTRNIDYTYSVLTLMATAHAAAWSPEYISIISVLLARIQRDIWHNPSFVIKSLKEAAAQFISWVRSPIVDVTTTELRHYLEHNGYSSYVVDLIVLYDVHFRSSPISQSIHLVQMAYAFLSLHRVVVLPVSANYTTITSPATYKSDKQLESTIPQALELLGITRKEFTRVLKTYTSSWSYKISLKGGPNGKAIFSARADGFALASNEKVLKAFIALSEHMGMSSLMDDLLTTVDLPEYVSRHTDDYVLGRFLEIEEWGGKKRIVATVDYWTQTLLEPLHQTINHFLRQLPMDGTFDQTRVAMGVKQSTSSLDSTVYSFDLTAATDRLPVIFQRSILTSAFGNANPALNWERVLVARDYETPAGELLKYAVGQPMGAKSSFPMLALTHHVIVQMAALRSGSKELFTKYGIIGDDIFINDTTVALEYQAIMSALGVTINTSKSILHVSGNLPAGELAKRLFIHGHEVTAIPVKLIAKMSVNPVHVTTLQDHLIDRGAFKASKELLIMLSGAIDEESARRLYAINVLPSSVTGLQNPIGPIVPSLDLSLMYPNIQVDARDIQEAYLYTAVVEQIKRLDALLKETGLISGIVMEKAGTRLGLSDFDEELPLLSPARASLKAKLPALTPSHPFVKAVASETDRISALLAALRGGTTELASVAKVQLLDMFRNAVSDIFDPWTGDSERVPSFTLMNKALTSLDTIILDKEGTKLDFSVMVVNLGRHYSVMWIRGKGVYVNTVKTRVEQSLTLLTDTSTTVASEMLLSPRRDRAEGAALRYSRRALKARLAKGIPLQSTSQ
jgi:hypothetical protein